MALAIDHGRDHIRVLSDLSGRVVHALLGDGDNGSSGADPFSVALRSYREGGDPGELGPRWRRLAAGRGSAGASAATVLRLLARDLLEVVASPENAPAASTEEAAEEAPPPNVRPIDRAPTSVPALERASDGSWRPSAGTVVASADAEAAQRRQAAFVPSLTSRYPTRRVAGPLVDIPIPPDVASSPAPVERAPQRPIARETTPATSVDVTTRRVSHEPIPTPAKRAEPENLIQAVSGGTELVAGPFDRFQDLAAFAKAIRAIPGVQSVTTRQFVRGTVHMRVRHSPAFRLVDTLRDLTEFRPSIVSDGPGKIELTVELPAPPPAEA